MLVTEVILQRSWGCTEIVPFLPAFAVSLVWNTVVNRLWTFADVRQQGADRGVRGYLGKALLSGALMFATYGKTAKEVQTALVSVALGGKRMVVHRKIAEPLLVSIDLRDISFDPV